MPVWYPMDAESEKLRWVKKEHTQPDPTCVITDKTKPAKPFYLPDGTVVDMQERNEQPFGFNCE